MTSSPESKARRLPRRFVLELTWRCNHACQYCYRFWPASRLRSDPPASPVLTTREIEAIVAKLQDEAPVETIALSGGEPLLRPDLPQIVSFIEKRGIAPAVISNGGLLTDAVIEQIGRDTTFEISLLSHKAEVHDRLAGRRGAWDAAVNAMASLRKARRPFIGVFVATRANAPDMRTTVELMIALGAYAVMYNRLNLSRQHRRNADRLLPTIEMVETNLRDLDDMAGLYGLGATVSVVIEPCVVDVRKYPRLHFGWCPRGGEDSYFTIDPVGNVRICNHSPVVLGNIRTDCFHDLYESAPVRAFYETWPEECAECPAELRTMCGGGCRAAAEQWYGTIARVDPFVELRRRTAPIPHETADASRV